MATKLTIAAALALLVPALALAAGLGLASGELGAGTASVAACDSSFTVSYTTSGGNVTVVTVSDIADPGCEGGELSVTLVDSGGGSIAGGGPIAIPADGDSAPGSLAMAVDLQPAAESVAGVRVIVTGP